jgi:hypothetical protein
MPTDSTLVFPPGYRVTDASGSPISGAKIKFYNAGGLVARTVYSDSGLSSSLGSTVFCGSDGFPVASSGSSTPVNVYTGTTAYKVIITTSADVTIQTLDNRIGALDTSTFLTSGSTSTLSIPVTSKTGNYTLVAADRGKLVQGNPSGGNFTLTLDAAATLGDGWNAEVRNSGTSGQVMLAASQAISFEGQTFTTRALQIGEAFAIRCDGTAFKITAHTPPFMASRNPAVITITDRVTSDPGAPTPGARYIVQTGYGSYATGDIIEANNVSFNKYTPSTNCGWIAWVQDENRYYTFQDSAWVLGMDPAASSTVAGLIKVSTQALMETGTATDTAVLIGHQKHHPGHPKAGGNLNGSGTPAFAAGDYGMGAVTDNGVGNYVVALDTAFADTNYWCAGYARCTDVVGSTQTGVMSSGSDGVKTASTFQVKGFTVGGGSAGANQDNTETGMTFWGDYA